MGESPRRERRKSGRYPRRAFLELAGAASRASIESPFYAIAFPGGSTFSFSCFFRSGSRRTRARQASLHAEEADSAARTQDFPGDPQDREEISRSSALGESGSREDAPPQPGRPLARLLLSSRKPRISWEGLGRSSGRAGLLRELVLAYPRTPREKAGSSSSRKCPAWRPQDGATAAPRTPRP